MAEAMADSKLVTVFGGSGFVGRHTVWALAQAGYRVRVAVRRPELAGFMRSYGLVGQIHPIQANVRDDASVRQAIVGADAIINLIGILAASGKQTFQAVQAEGAARVARISAENGITRFVHMSAIGADRNSNSRYARSKGEGEDAVLQAIPNAVILRPSIVFGPEDDFFNRFAQMARFSPVLPLIGGGKTKFQPVYVGDVAKAVVAALEGRANPGAIYELGGPHVYTFRELLKKIGEYTQRKRAFVSLPFWLATMQAAFVQWLPNAPLTVDQVRLLKKDNVVSQRAKDEGLTLETLGIKPTSVEVIVPDYLWRFRSRGEFAREDVPPDA
jgi:NADH dehydrogenase